LKINGLICREDNSKEVSEMKLAIELIKKFNKARIEIDSRFTGLLHVHTALIKSLITLANPLTGIVTDITYSDIAELLTVNKAPGRTESGIPQKQTIRSYIRSIEKQCPEDFKVISEGQKLQFQFPKLPAIYAKFLGNTKEYTVHNNEAYTSNPLENTEENDDLETHKNTEEYTERYTDVYTPESAVKNINIFNKTNPNKQTQTAASDFSCNKKPISEHFHPDVKTIELALSKGLSKVTDSSEIQAFIKHNKKLNTQWADFNPVFIHWLERDAQYIQNQQLKTQGQLRSNRNERGINQIPFKQTALDRVGQHHGISTNALWGESGNEISSGEFIEGELITPLDEAHSHIRTAFCKQAWS
jgi:hypothetical protein